MNSKIARDKFISNMKEYGINCSSHYEPLHLSAFGKKFNNLNSNLKITEEVSKRIIRFPIWVGIEEHQDFIIEKTNDILKLI